MPFIGKSPQVGAFQLIDSITTSATDTYALTVSGSAYVPESARNLIVSLNGVTQAPESAYTVSGSNIVFASALTASDVIDYILVIGDAVDIGTPSDNTVGDAQLKPSLNLSSKTLTFANDQISGDVINGGTISSFASTGIDDNATSTAITIDSSENVGIGISNPLGQLHINTETAEATKVYVDGEVNQPKSIEIRHYDTSEGSGAGRNLFYLKTPASGRLDIGNFSDGSTETQLMTFLEGGNVGIGTTSPTGFAGYTSLDINNNTSGAIIDLSQGDVMKGRFVATSSTMAIETSAGVPLIFQPAGTERMRIDSSGFVGIGTTGPVAHLSVNAGGSPDATYGIANFAASAGNNSYVTVSRGGNDQGGIKILRGSVADLSIHVNAAESSIINYNGGDTNDGLFFRSGSAQTEVMALSSSGNVGIGTTSPAMAMDIVAANNSQLRVDSSDTNDTTIFMDYNGTGASDRIRIKNSAGNFVVNVNNTSEAMRIDSSGRVGIRVTPDAWRTTDSVLQLGTQTSVAGLANDTHFSNNAYFDTGSTWKAQNTAQAANYYQSSGIHVWRYAGTTTADTAISWSEAMRIDSSGNLDLYADKNLSWRWLPADYIRGQITVTSANHMTFTTAYSERLRIDSSGRVGIGTTSPSAPLHVKTSSGDSIILVDNGTSQARFAIDNDGPYVYALTSGDLALRVFGNSTERMRIDSSGRLMIGTTSPISTSAFLSLYQSTGNVYGQAYSASISNGQQVIFQAGARASGTTADRYCALSSYKHAGVTNAAPYLYLQEEDGNAAYYWTDNNGVLKYSNSAANVGTTGGGAVGAQTSDERLKTIEEGFEYGIETVKALTPIAYRRNDEESPERKLGFGAQTTQAIVPEVVFDTGDCLDGYDGEGVEATPKTNNTILGMEYVQLIPVLTKAIQEQQAMIEELKAEVAALKGA